MAVSPFPPEVGQWGLYLVGNAVSFLSGQADRPGAGGDEGPSRVAHVVTRVSGGNRGLEARVWEPCCWAVTFSRHKLCGSLALLFKKFSPAWEERQTPGPPYGTTFCPENTCRIPSGFLVFVFFSNFQN